MTMLDFQMHALDIARGLGGLGVNWLIQSTLLIVAGLWIGVALRTKGSAVQSAVYRTTLAAVLVCPIVSWSLAQLGATGWSLEMPDAYLYEATEVAQAEQRSVPPPVDVEPEPIAAALSEAVEPLGEFDPLGQAALESSSTSSSSSDTSFFDDVRQAVPDLSALPIELPPTPAPTFAFNANWFGIAAVVAGAVWLL